MTSRNQPPRWWQLPWRVIVSFPLGAGMLIYETVFDANRSALIVGAGLALCGVTGTGVIQKYVKRRLEE